MRAAADVAVVGGGVIGAACARELARAGASVVLLERSELAAGASGRNHGLIVAPAEAVLGPMATSSLEVYRELASDPPVPFGLDDRPIGYLIVAGDDQAERRQARAEAEASRAFGLRAELVGAEEIRRLEPALAPDFVEGWLVDDGLRLDPAALTVALALDASRDGAEVLRNLPVRALESRGGGWRVATDVGAVDVDTVVVAAGPWSPVLLRPLGIQAPVVGARGWLLHLEPGEPPIARIVERAGWHLLPGEDAIPPLSAEEVARSSREPEIGTLLQPGADGTVLVGGSRQLSAVHEPEDHDVPRELARRAIRLVPSLADARALSAWWGIRPMSPDGRPIVGEVLPGLVLASGHGSQGVILAGGTARLAASIVLGAPDPFDAGPFDPSRFEAPAQ